MITPQEIRHNSYPYKMPWSGTTIPSLSLDHWLVKAYLCPGSAVDGKMVIGCYRNGWESETILSSYIDTVLVFNTRSHKFEELNITDALTEMCAAT